MGRLRSIVAAFRPKTLTASLAPCLAATGLTKALGHSIDWGVFWLALTSASCIQIATNLINDAIDFKKGADTEERIGPTRITQAGILSSRHVLALGFAFAGLAILLGVPLVILGGWPIVGVGLVSVLLAYSYTGGPLPLAYLGLGEIFVVLFFGLVAVATLCFLYFGEWQFESLVLGIQIGLLAAVLIAINNSRDRLGDERVEKKTLAVRFGDKFSRYEIGVLSLTPFLINFYWYAHGWIWPTVLPLLMLPYSLKFSKKVFQTEPGPVYNKYLSESAILHLGFSVLLTIGYLC